VRRVLATSSRPDDQADALLLFNELLDALNVDGRAIYNRTFTTYTLTPLLQPHTIGLSANAPTFAVTIGRPKKIVAANIVLTGNIRKELELLDEQGWNAIKAGAAAGRRSRSRRRCRARCSTTTAGQTAASTSGRRRPSPTAWNC
jgi:hypothetical protein